MSSKSILEFTATLLASASKRSRKSPAQLVAAVDKSRSASAPKNLTEDASRPDRFHALAERMAKRAPAPSRPSRPVEKSRQTISQGSRMHPSPNPALYSIHNASRAAKTDRSQTRAPELEETHDSSQFELVNCDDLFGDLTEFQESSGVDPPEFLQDFSSTPRSTAAPGPSSSRSRKFRRELPKPAGAHSRGGLDDLSGPIFDDWSKNPVMAEFIAENGF